MGNTRILLGRGKGGTLSNPYPGVTFTRPRFSLWEAACARLSRGYVALGALERQCAHLQFQEPRTIL